MTGYRTRRSLWPTWSGAPDATSWSLSRLPLTLMHVSHCDKAYVVQGYSSSRCAFEIRTRKVQNEARTSASSQPRDTMSPLGRHVISALCSSNLHACSRTICTHPCDGRSHMHATVYPCPTTACRSKHCSFGPPAGSNLCNSGRRIQNLVLPATTCWHACGASLYWRVYPATGSQ